MKWTAVEIPGFSDIGLLVSYFFQFSSFYPTVYSNCKAGIYLGRLHCFYNITASRLSLITEGLSYVSMVWATACGLES